MNVASGLQIRQLLFPDAVEGGVRAFKAPNPLYEELMAQGVKPRPRKWTELELHGLWVAAGRLPGLLLALLKLHGRMACHDPTCGWLLGLLGVPCASSWL